MQFSKVKRFMQRKISAKSPNSWKGRTMSVQWSWHHFYDCGPCVHLSVRLNILIISASLKIMDNLTTGFPLCSLHRQICWTGDHLNSESNSSKITNRVEFCKSLSFEIFSHELGMFVTNPLPGFRWHCRWLGGMFTIIITITCVTHNWSQEKINIPPSLPPPLCQVVALLQFYSPDKLVQYWPPLPSTTPSSWPPEPPEPPRTRITNKELHKLTGWRLRRTRIKSYKVQDEAMSRWLQSILGLNIVSVSSESLSERSCFLNQSLVSDSLCVLAGGDNRAGGQIWKYSPTPAPLTGTGAPLLISDDTR